MAGDGIVRATLAHVAAERKRALAHPNRGWVKEIVPRVPQNPLPRARKCPKLRGASLARISQYHSVQADGMDPDASREQRR